MSLENRVRYCQFDSSYLLPSSSPTHRKTSDEPAEDCLSRDYSVRDLLFIAVSLLRHYLGLLGAVILRVKTAIGFENDNP